MTITFDALKNEVLRLATEHPDVIYPRKKDPSARACFYTRGECGSGVGCIFGQALTNLDPSLRDKLQKIDNDPQSAAGINWVLHELGIVVDRDEDRAAWCCSVQGSQDIGVCWGDAVKVKGN